MNSISNNTSLNHKGNPQVDTTPFSISTNPVPPPPPEGGGGSLPPQELLPKYKKIYLTPHTTSSPSISSGGIVVDGGGGSQQDKRIPPPPLPSVEELAQVEQELAAYLTTAAAYEAKIAENRKITLSWLKEETDRLAAIAAAATPPVVPVVSRSGASSLVTISTPTATGDPTVLDPSSLSSATTTTSIHTRGSEGEQAMTLAISENGIIKITPAGPSIKLSSTPAQPSTQSSADSASSVHARSGSSGAGGKNNTNSKTKGLSASRRSAQQRKDRQSLLAKQASIDAAAAGGPAAGDYSKVKPNPNPTPIAQFWSYCEHYFRAITEKDLKILEDDGDSVAPFVMPRLGMHYTDQWIKEDQYLLASAYHEAAASSNGLPMNSSSQSLLPPTPQDSKEYSEQDGIIFAGSVAFGSLAERVISALLDEKMTLPATNASSGSSSSNMAGATGGVEADQESVCSTEDDDTLAPHTPRPASDLLELEERFRHELLLIGLVDEGSLASISGGNTTPQASPEGGKDEISSLLRQAQAELRQVRETNKERRAKIRELALNWMGWQEYQSVSDEISKVIEAGYIKRHQPSVSRKKSDDAGAPLTHLPFPDPLINAMNNRKRLHSEVGVYFDRENFKLGADESIFED